MSPHRVLPRWPSALASLLIAALLAVAGCTGADRPGGADGRSEGVSPGPLLAFTATTLDGRQFDGMSLSGKPAVLWFWAPWCPTCLAQAPGVRAAVEQHGDNVGIVGVAGLDSVAAMPEFVRLAKVEAITHLADEQGVVWRRFGIAEQSIFVLIDTSRRVVYRGRLEADEIPGRVAALLN